MPCCDKHPRVMTPQEEQRELEGDPLEWLPPEEVYRMSDLVRFYDGAEVFLTGATGFIGTLILEKLLRSCPGVSTIYVLIRDKKGVPLRERLRSHLDKVVFSEARKACPDYLQKVVPIAGDCTQPGLGISPADAAELCSKVSVVFHVAATVKFDADLRTAAVTNVASTCSVIALAKRMPNLKALVYMSTAYSNCTRHDIDEEFYPPAMTSGELLKLISVMNDEQLAQILPLLIGDWPNTYTFTKAIAEDAIRTDAAGLPVSIIRPSIVTGTFREPLALWVGNVYGPSGVGLGSAVGLLHALPMDPKAMADGVPADMVANATIACAWDTWCRHSKQTLTQQTPTEPVIYNCIAAVRHPMSWGQIIHYAHEGRNYPSIRNMWAAYIFLIRHKYLYVIATVICHLIPAVFADTFLRLQGMKPILWKMYSRIHGVSLALQPFMTREWIFKDDNLVSLLGRLGAVDRKLFPFDVADVDWEFQIANAMRGMRYYILNESFDNLEAARKRYRRLVIIHYSVVTMGCALLLFLLWRIFAAQVGL